MSPREVLAKILQLEADLEESRQLFLRLRAWTYTSSTPDFCWRWSKEFDGLRYVLAERDAFELERRQTGPEGT